MDLLTVFLSSLGSVATLFVLTKIMGNRQMSQLSMFDYITGITIGSIAAEMATSLENDFLKPLLAMLVYGILSITISFSNDKSLRLRKFFLGEPLVLFENGKLFKENLKKAKLDTSEFLVECRNNGYFNLADIHTAILETNGKISILPLEGCRPLKPRDMGIATKQEKLIANVVMDGKAQVKNLQQAGKSEKWLADRLREKGITNIANIFLATLDQDGQINVYITLPDENKKNFFA